VPVDDRREGAVFLGDLQPHEAMSEDEVLKDFASGVDLEIARRQGGEVRLQFFLAQVFGQEPANLIHEQFALLFFGTNELGPAGHQADGTVMKAPEK